MATTTRPPAPLGYYHRGGAKLMPATSVRRSARWAGSGPAHWHAGPVVTRQLAGPQHGPVNLATVRSRGMYGY